MVAEQWFSNVEIEREVRPLARFNDRLSAFARVIRFDKRGVGLSDPVPAAALPTLEEWMDDLRAVLDEVGSEKAAIVTAMAGGSSPAFSRRRIRTACAPSYSSTGSRD